jgi:chromosome segregation ATPase
LRTVAAEARLAEAQQRVADLSGEMADLRIRHEDVVADAEEAREKLFSLVERAHKDQEEAQKGKNKRDELLRALGQFQSKLESIRRENHTLCVNRRHESSGEAETGPKPQVT